MLQNFLESIGLSDKEAQVYLAMLLIGTNPASVIARQAGLSRTTVYSLLETLQQKNFVSQFTKQKITYYAPERPENMITLLDRDLRSLNQQRQRCRELLPEFRALMDAHLNLPKVHYFEGIDGVKAIYEDTLKEGQDKLAYSCAPSISDPRLKDWMQDYVKRRVKKGIKVQAIFPDSKESKARAKEDKATLTESRLVPAKDFPFKSEVNIYGNKMAIMSLGENYHGVIIESADIVDTQRSIFKLAWRGAA